MNEVNDGAIPKSFYWISGLLFAWNLVGISIYVGEMTISEEALAGMTEAQRAFITMKPAWAKSVYAIAVTAGTLGCLLLLLRKALAVPVLIVSLVCVLLQNLHGFFLSNGWDAYGPAGLGISLPVIAIGAYLVKYSLDAKNKGWIS